MKLIIMIIINNNNGKQMITKIKIPLLTNNNSNNNENYFIYMHTHIYIYIDLFIFIYFCIRMKTQSQAHIIWQTWFISRKKNRLWEANWQLPPKTRALTHTQNGVQKHRMQKLRALLSMNTIGCEDNSHKVPLRG